jgi:hypothetical protein
MRRLTGPIGLVLAAALAAGGCGGDDKSNTPAASTPTVTTLQTPTLPAPAAVAAKPDVLDPIAKRLRDGGYKVAGLDVSAPAVAARRVGDHVLLYAYKTSAAAEDGAAVIKRAIRQNPKRGVLDTEGTRVYFFGDRKDVTAAERASFADLVDVGEGRISP